MNAIEQIDDAVAAAAFRRLVRHLRHRSDAANVDLMGLAGFCRNCLSDWIVDAAREAGQPLPKEDARAAIYGMPYADWKARHQVEATPEQLARMEASVARNHIEDALDAALDETFPASDPPAMTGPGR